LFLQEYLKYCRRRLDFSLWVTFFSVASKLNQSMMQPPITVGTVLQNRYRIIQILGQGGFGRTYLAEDQRRFNELCAIKELISTAMGASAWEKAQELFQREAAILYQIKHPQIPEFRERFEEDKRVFLVQEYIPGKTYRALLEERKGIGGAFTEAEALQLMRSLLPVLEHIHDRGIIHRDISPENIILRSSDVLPVLIDFGVVKEIATRLQSPNATTPATSVGKLGYAPSEQMQTGRAYPNSDLYALAVTVVVLLTGKEPTELFDENQLTWNWQRWVTVKPAFAQVLNRMLSHIPGTRYQSAADVVQALQFLDEPAAPNQNIPPNNSPNIPPNNSPNNSPNISNVQTVAVGRRPDAIEPPIAPNRPNYRPEPIIPEPQTRSVLDNPLAIGAIGSAVVILAGFGSWAIVSSLRNQPQAPLPEAPPQTFPSPVITGGTILTPTPTPTETATNNEPVKFSKRLNFGASNPISVDGKLKVNETIQYTFNGAEGLQLTALLSQESGVLLTVFGPNQELVDNAAKQVTFYQGTLPFTGKYTVELTPAPGISEVPYNLKVGLENIAKPIPTESPTEEPTVTPTETPPTEKPPTKKLPIVTPTETPPTEKPPTEQPPTQPPTEQPSIPIPGQENNSPVDGTLQPVPGKPNSP
jgi:serine/threonine protein kinase